MENVLQLLEEEKTLILEQYRKYICEYIDNNITSKEMETYIMRKVVLITFIEHLKERINIRLTYLNK